MARPADEGVVQAVKEAVDIVQVVGEVVNLRRTGANYLGLCPFHGEKTPSFTVSPARKFFHCFGCGESGDVLTFVMRHQNLPFWEALKQLAGRYHIPLPERELSHQEREADNRRQELYLVNQRAADLYHDLLLNDPRAALAREYLAKRRIPPEIITRFRLGYAPERWDFLSKALPDTPPELLVEAGLIVARDSGGGFYDRFRQRVLFPIINHSGRHLGFGGRALSDGQQPKYLNSPETAVFTKGRTLFGLFQAKEAIRRTGRAVVVEGNFDLISLVAAGIGEVVAPLGTALTPQHVRALKGYAGEVVLLFDGDSAGVKAALRAVPLFLSARLPARVVVLPDGHDPDTFINQYGPAELTTRLEAALSLPEFAVEQLVARHGLGLEGKGRILEELRPLVAAIDDKDLQRSLFISHFSRTLGLTPEQLGQALAGGLGLPPAPPVPAPALPRQGIKLTDSERHLLAFLVLYPACLDDFVEAGLLEVMASPAAFAIVEAMREAARQTPDGGAERLLDYLAGPEERDFVAAQLIDAPTNLPEREREAAEKIGWLLENRRKTRTRELTTRIKEAQLQNDQALVLELLTEKKKLSLGGQG